MLRGVIKMLQKEKTCTMIVFSVDGREVTLSKDLVERYSEVVCPVVEIFLQSMIHVFGKNCNDELMSAKISLDMEKELDEYA